MHTNSRQILHRKLNFKHISWSTLGSLCARKVFFTVLIGSIMVAAVAVVFNKYVLKYKYPHYWW